MEHIKNLKKTHLKPSQNSETVEVLYQKMGNKWYAFSLIEEEIYVGSLSQDEVDGAVEKLRKMRKKMPRPA